MVSVIETPVPSYPKALPVPSKGEVQSSATPHALSFRDQRTIPRTSTSTIAEIKGRTYQSKTGAPRIPRFDFESPNHSPTPSLHSKPNWHDDQIPELANNERSQTASSENSYTSTSPPKNTIFIEPSRGLQETKRVVSDAGISCKGAARHHSNEYVTQHQFSFHAPDEYRLTENPQAVFDQEEHAKGMPSPSSTASNQLETRPSLALEVKNWNDAIKWAHPTEIVYGPSNEDIQSLLDRREEWEEKQQRRSSSFRRWPSFKDFTTGVVRTLSKGKEKKQTGLVADNIEKAKPVRMTSERQKQTPLFRAKSEKKPVREKSRRLRKRNTVTGVYGGRRFVLSDETVFEKRREVVSEGSRGRIGREEEVEREDGNDECRVEQCVAGDY